MMLLENVMKKAERANFGLLPRVRLCYTVWYGNRRYAEVKRLVAEETGKKEEHGRSLVSAIFLLSVQIVGMVRFILAWLLTLDRNH